MDVKTSHDQQSHGHTTQHDHPSLPRHRCSGHTDQATAVRNQRTCLPQLGSKYMVLMCPIKQIQLVHTEGLKCPMPQPCLYPNSSLIDVIPTQDRVTSPDMQYSLQVHLTSAPPHSIRALCTPKRRDIPTSRKHAQVHMLCTDTEGEEESSPRT